MSVCVCVCVCGMNVVIQYLCDSNKNRACVLDVAKLEQYLWNTHWRKISNSRNLVNFGRRVQNKAALER